MVVRVVCAWRAVMAILSPTRALSSVDFPALGRPTIDTKPARWLTALRQPATESAHERCELLRRGAHCRRAPQYGCRLAPQSRQPAERDPAIRRPARRRWSIPCRFPDGNSADP